MAEKSAVKKQNAVKRNVAKMIKVVATKIVLVVRQMAVQWSQTNVIPPRKVARRRNPAVNNNSMIGSSEIISEEPILNTK
jgi:hypothetical protein